MLPFRFIAVVPFLFRIFVLDLHLLLHPVMERAAREFLEKRALGIILQKKLVFMRSGQSFINFRIRELDTLGR